MRERKNARTVAILAALRGRKARSAEEIAGMLGASMGTVQVTLLRLKRAALVDRRWYFEGGVIPIDEEEGITRKRRVYRYLLTKKGQARLAYLEG